MNLGRVRLGSAKCAWVAHTVITKYNLVLHWGELSATHWDKDPTKEVGQNTWCWEGFPHLLREEIQHAEIEVIVTGKGRSA